MKITVQITVKSDEAESVVVQEVAHLDRGPLHPETLGLSLAEARTILAGLEQGLVEQQSAEFHRPAGPLPPMRPRARLQGASPNRVPYPFR